MLNKWRRYRTRIKNEWERDRFDQLKQDAQAYQDIDLSGVRVSNYYGEVDIQSIHNFYRRVARELVWLFDLIEIEDLTDGDVLR
jgi:hypothetical protein